MQKGENIISIALAAVVFFTTVAIQRKWNPASLKEAASSAEDFILTTTGIRGQVPQISGYEIVKTFRLEPYRAALYRASPAPLVFAPGRLVIYDARNAPVFKLETLEGSRDAWTALYDFRGRHGLPAPGGRARPEFMRDLTGDGTPDIIVGQYSGGDHCCTIATVVELGKESVKNLGRIDGLDGLPFEGLEVRRMNKNPGWELIAHRPYGTTCGTRQEDADVVSVYAYVDGRYTDKTATFPDYLSELLRQNLAKWKGEKTRSLELLQTVAINYAMLGQRDEGARFFAMNLNLFMPDLKTRGVDPNACIDDLEALLGRVPSITP
jgi:hypothetical protein